jgi:signal transduction histidine kinase
VTATRSLRSRLAWSASAVVTVWVAAFVVAGNLLLGSALTRQVDTMLDTRAAATADTVQVSPDGRVSVLLDDDDTALDVGTWVLGRDGAPLESPPRSTPALDAAAAALARGGGTTAEVDVAEPVRLLAHPVRDGGDRVATVVTSTSLAPYQDLRRLVWIASVVVAAVVLAAMHLVLRATVGRALRPVQEMTAQADRWSAADVDRRFGQAQRPAELEELARTLDAVLERIGAVLRRERQLSDELSHELRTPLTRIQAEVDLLGARPRDPAELAAAHASIAEAATDMEHIVDTLMSSARAGAGSLTGRCDAAPVLERLAARLREARPDLAVRVRAASPAPVGVEEALLERLLSPVVENAGRYARSRVELAADRAGGRVCLQVHDDGPGVPADRREVVFRPGWRGEPGDGHPGAGLGLSLARRLAEAAGGSIAVAEGPGGRFAVDLPAG